MEEGISGERKILLDFRTALRQPKPLNGKFVTAFGALNMTVGNERGASSTCKCSGITNVELESTFRVHQDSLVGLLNLSQRTTSPLHNILKVIKNHSCGANIEKATLFLLKIKGKDKYENTMAHVPKSM